MREWVRRHRWLCSWLAAVLLFGQLAVAAYACPTRVQPPDQAVEAGTALPGCTGHHDADADPHQPLLCKAHCDGDERSVNSAPIVGDAGPAPLGVLLRVLDVAHAEAIAAAMPAASTAGPPRGAPPIYLNLLVLRN